MVSTSAIDLSQYPQDLIAFATDEAGRDAIDVGDFLAAAGLAPPPGETRGIPKGILLDLGAVVRLRRWEAAGYTIHLDAGLPSAREALHGVIRTLIIAAETPAGLDLAGALGRAAFDLMVTRFAWAARTHPSSHSKVVISADPTVISSEESFLALCLPGQSILWAKVQSLENQWILPLH